MELDPTFQRTLLCKQASHSNVYSIFVQFDQACNIKPKSIHHTKSSSETDRNKIIQELLNQKYVITFLAAIIIPSRI